MCSPNGGDWEAWERFEERAFQEERVASAKVLRQDILENFYIKGKLFGKSGTKWPH